MNKHKIELYWFLNRHGNYTVQVVSSETGYFKIYIFDTLEEVQAFEQGWQLEETLDKLIWKIYGKDA